MSCDAEMPEFSQHRSRWSPMCSRKVQRLWDFESFLVKCRSPQVTSQAKGPPYQLPPFTHKEKRDLVFSLEYSKNERLDLGEF